MPECRLILPALAALGLLGGCANQAKRQQAELMELRLALPGIYSSDAATLAPTPAPTPGDAVTLSITPVEAQLIGDAVFFVRETAADNERLVLSQRIWTLALDPRTGIVQQSFFFKDPRRWVGVAHDPDTLVALLPADLQALPGCELLWQKTVTGFQTVGAPVMQPRRRGKHARPKPSEVPAPPKAPSGCRPGAAAQGLWIEQRERLSGRELSLDQRRTAADGTLEAADAPLSLVLTRGAPSTQPQR